MTHLGGHSDSANGKKSKYVLSSIKMTSATNKHYCLTSRCCSFVPRLRHMWHPAQTTATTGIALKQVDITIYLPLTHRANDSEGKKEEPFHVRSHD